MTVVAAVAREGRVTMAADTCTNYGGTHIRGVRKIARIKVAGDDALIAASGTGALLGLPAHWSCDTAPDSDDPADVQAWAFELSRGLCELAAAQTPPLIDRDQLAGAYLLGWRGRLIYLFTHQAAVLDDGVAALGMGSDYVFGHLEARLDLPTIHPGRADTARWLVEDAVIGACNRYDGCRVGADGPLVESLEPPAPPVTS